MKEYYMPVKVLMDDGVVEKNGEILKRMGQKAMIVTGRNSAKLCGALEDVTRTLERNGQQWVLFDRVMSNPDVACCCEGGALAREEGADFIIAIGGGSPMDAAKAMAVLAKEDMPQERLMSKVYPKGALPMVHIPTTAGTGSETTPYAILTIHEDQTKRSIGAPCLFPACALLDAAYLEKMPIQALRHTVIDSLSHSVEGMTSQKAGIITDGLAQRALGLLADVLEPLAEGTLTPSEYKKLLLASTLGGMVIANTGTSVVHTMGYSLTYFMGTDHGRANGLLLPEFLRVVERSDPGRIREILSYLRMEKVDQLEDALNRLLGQRETLTEEQISEYTEAAAGSKNIKTGRVQVTKEDIRHIFETSLGR